MESLQYLLMKTHTMLNKKIVSGAGELGLTSGQPKVLDFLTEHEGCDQKTIAAYCEIEPATVGSILLRMENQGMIRRIQHPGNRRSLFVYLTEQGRKAAKEMAKVFDSCEEEAAGSLPGEELEELKILLTKLWENLSGKQQDPSEETQGGRADADQ